MAISISQSPTIILSNEVIVALSELGKQYKSGTEALKGITLDITKGDLFGLIGPDGAGKTTLLRILSGIMKPTTGTAMVLGMDPGQARRQISYVPQDCAMYPDLTVEENLRYQAGLYGVDAKSLAKVQETHLKNMGLLKFSNRLAGQLSGGMKQKLALCCALVSQPQLILLDEPTTGLDPIARRELWRELTLLAQEGVTAIIATPFLDEAERCTRIALMHDGELHQTGTPEELQKALHMRRLEITLADEQNKDEIWNTLSKATFTHISDIYLYGDRLEILAKDTKAAEAEVRDTLSGKNIAIPGVYETTPNMENVFIMRLRELGYTDSKPVPFPHLSTPKSADSPTHQSAIAIEAQQLCRQFQDFRAVENVNLKIGFGDIYGLLGANGAGKTTTIKMLCGLLDPSSGLVSLDGQSKDLRSRKICKRIGYMSQKFTLYDALTVIENLTFYASIYEIPLKQRKQQIDWVTQACGLGNILHSIVGSLPLGWKQRIAFGAAVMHEPDIIFLDEPTAGVDPLARRQLWSLIREIARNGAAVLVTTHYLDEAEYCNRVAFMAASKIVAQGSPGEIKSRLSGQVIEIKTNNTPEAYRALSKHLDSWQVSIFGNSLHVLIENSDDAVERINSLLLQSGCEIKSIRPIPCSLEDAFIDIVQRSEREAM